MRKMFLIVWMVLIFILSVIPVSGPETDMPVDKVEHFIIYGVTAVFFYRYLRPKTIKAKAGFESVLIAAAYGAAIEVVQYFLPYRSFSMADMAANTLGAVVFCMIYIMWKE
jgi:VanZ family protein